MKKWIKVANDCVKVYLSYNLYVILVFHLSIYLLVIKYTKFNMRSVYCILYIHG